MSVDTTASPKAEQVEGEATLTQVVSRLVEAFKPERIYLFGSQARGDAGPDSDYDIMVVVPDDSPPEQRQSRLASACLRGTGLAADILVWTKMYFDCRLHLKASLPSTVVREGKLLYAATPNDPVRVADTRAWLHKASLDLRAGESLLLTEPPLTSDAVFHVQQVAEKVLRAFLTWHDQPLRKTSNIDELGQACVEIDGSLHAVLRHGGDLTEYAWKYRYPGASQKPSRREAEEALATARAIHAAILERLPQEVRS